MDEIVGDLSEEKELLQKKVEEKKILLPQHEELQPLLEQISGVIDRQIPRGIPIPLVKVKKGYFPFTLDLLEKGDYSEEWQKYFDFGLLWLSLHQYLKPTFDTTQLLRILLQQK
ncbi:MAG: hypothetical protein LBG52_01160 [Candidatus Peribacteria bacterium]|nr:hypothetical protein [Candidatus Peribacteria bacterium]